MALQVVGILAVVLLVVLAAFSEAGVVVLDAVVALTAEEEAGVEDLVLGTVVVAAVVLLHPVEDLLRAMEHKDSMDPDNNSNEPEQVQFCLEKNLFIVCSKNSRNILPSVPKLIRG